MNRLLVAALLLALTCPTAAQTPQKKFMAAPVTIEDQGSFFVGGMTKVTDFAAVPFAPPGQTPPAPVPQQITIGQMYVQFQIPMQKSGPGWPVIMVHGSTHTGAALESTPDGREGWFPYFVRKGVSTYVVDQSGRGRSGFDQSVLHEAEAKMVAGDVKTAAELIPNFGRITDNGAWTAWFGHLLPAGSNISTGTLVPHADPRDPEKPTDGRPHVAPKFPLASVAEYYKQLEGKGIKLTKKFGKSGDMNNIMTASMVDPWGVSIELTEGLNKLSQ